MSEQSAYQQNEETEQQISNHQKEKTMKAIDKSVPAYYAAGREYHRLRENIGLIEFERTKVTSAALTENTRGGWLISAMRCICLIYRKPISE